LLASVIFGLVFVWGLGVVSSVVCFFAPAARQPAQQAAARTASSTHAAAAARSKQVHLNHLFFLILIFFRMSE
jgi:hypothetical protein